MPKQPKPNLTAIAGGKGDGSGPEDPMLEQRVSAVEGDLRDIKSTLKAIEARMASMDVSLAEMRGKLSQAPSWVQLVGLTLATWVAGATIVATLLRFAK
jgi:hypothetical protein